VWSAQINEISIYLHERRLTAVTWQEVVEKLPTNIVSARTSSVNTQKRPCKIT
jgi:hypothetical protein